MFSKLLIITVLVTASITAAVVVRADDASPYSQKTVAELKAELSHALTLKYSPFNHPRVELGTIRLVSGMLPKDVKSVEFESENTQGQAQFSVYGDSDSAAVISVNYAAFADVRIATRRVMPGQKLSNKQFSTEEVNLATGTPYELRGVLLSSHQNITHLEARQTILEGQYLVSNAVEKIPDIRQGDSVRIRVITGALRLTALGTAAESGYENSPIKVVTASTHRELTGILRPNGIVEVKL